MSAGGEIYAIGAGSDLGSSIHLAGIRRVPPKALSHIIRPYESSLIVLEQERHERAVPVHRSSGSNLFSVFSRTGAARTCRSCSPLKRLKPVFCVGAKVGYANFGTNTEKLRGTAGAEGAREQSGITWL